MCNLIEDSGIFSNPNNNNENGYTLECVIKRYVQK